MGQPFLLAPPDLPLGEKQRKKSVEAAKGEWMLSVKERRVVYYSSGECSENKVFCFELIVVLFSIFSKSREYDKNPKWKFSVFQLSNI